MRRDALFFPLPFLLVGLVLLSLAAERGIRSDLESALGLCGGAAAALGVFVSAVGSTRKSWALEILGGTLAAVGIAAMLYTRFGALGLAAPLALLAVMVLVRYTLLARRKSP